MSKIANEKTFGVESGERHGPDTLFIVIKIGQKKVYIEFNDNLRYDIERMKNINYETDPILNTR